MITVTTASARAQNARAILGAAAGIAVGAIIMQGIANSQRQQNTRVQKSSTRRTAASKPSVRQTAQKPVKDPFAKAPSEATNVSKPCC
jgi:hypothetical protein